MLLRRTGTALALTAVLSLAISATPATASAACRSADARPAALSLGAIERATLCLVNRERVRRGRRRLRRNPRLARAARRHARDMVRRRYFAHRSLSGASFVSRIKRTGYLRGARSWKVGENLAWGGQRRATPRAIVRAWLRSPGHRRNMLSRGFREIGVAVVRGTPRGRSRDSAIYANEFGRRR